MSAAAPSAGGVAGAKNRRVVGGAVTYTGLFGFYYESMRARRKI
jgi:hypothetical protein